MSVSGPALSPARRAQAALVVVTVAWGLTFPMIKGALAEASPFQFLAIRFPIALVCLWPLLRWRIPSRKSLGAGLWLAFFLALSFYAQTLGLVYTTATRSAFITGLSVILVPILYPLFTRRAPARNTLAGAGLAVAGLYFLTDPGAGGLNRGDWITFLCASGYALYIIVLEVASRKHPYEDLLVLQFLPLAVIFLPPALAADEPVRWGPGLIWGVVTTGPILVLTLYLQNRFQKDTTAPRAAVIFTGEPLFAALFAYVLIGETLAAGQWAGGAIILAGILLAIRR